MALSSHTQLVITCILAALVHVMSAESTCSNYTFSDKREFSSCKDLPFLKAHLHWSYHPSNKSIHIAYRAQLLSSTGWVAWGINPMRSAMVGTQAIVAFRNPNGAITAYTTSINSYNPSMKPSPIGFSVSNLSANYFNGQMTIFALIWPLEKVIHVDHVWQAGPVSNKILASHAMSGPNIQSLGKIDFS